MGGGAHGCRWWYVFLFFFNQKAVYRRRGSHQHPHLLLPPIAMHHWWWSIVLQPGFWAAYMPLPERQLLPIKCYNNLLKQQSFGDNLLYLYGCVTGITISSLKVFFLLQIQLRDVPISSCVPSPDSQRHWSRSNRVVALCSASTEKSVYSRLPGARAPSTHALPQRLQTTHVRVTRDVTEYKACALELHVTTPGEHLLKTCTSKRGFM